MAKKATRKRARRKRNRARKAIGSGVGLTVLLVGAGLGGRWLLERDGGSHAGNRGLSASIGQAAVIAGVPPLRPAGAALLDLLEGSGPIRFTYLHDHIFVTAALDGHAGTWLVDTGSNLTVMSPRIADLANLPPVNARAAVDPYGIARFVSARILTVGQAHAPLRVAGVMPKLEDQILRSDGVLVDGILGFDWLRQFRLQIDYPRHVLALLPPGPPEVALPHRFRVPLRVVNGVPLVPVRIDSGPARDCLLDTGSNVVNLPWTLALASGIRPTDPDIRPGPRIAGLGASSNTQSLRLSTLQIGPATYRGVRVALYSGVGVSARYGNLGNTLFGGDRLTVDPENQQVVLEE